MRLIIETDIGHDPDDFFAITYLLAAGVQIDAILVTPGDPDQLAIAGLLRDELTPRTVIGAVPGRTKHSSGSIHHDLLKRYGRSLDGQADCTGEQVFELKSIQPGESQAFVIGPPTHIGRYLKSGRTPFQRVTIQGGFAPYSVYRPSLVLDKFEGKDWMPTFNLNGDVEGAKTLLAAPMERQLVGKNVCHTIEFTSLMFSMFTPPRSRAPELFHEAAKLYFERHPSKKFHDPTAAVCHLHPEIGLWIEGKTTRIKGGWTTYPGEDQVLVDIDRTRLWYHLSTLT